MTQPRLRVAVTGGSSGIGGATALSFAHAGASVVGISRTHPMQSAHGMSHVRADLAEPESCVRAVDDAVERLGGLDVMVISAGLMLNDLVREASPSDWQSMVDVNLVAAMLCSQAALPYLSVAASGERGCADLVLIGSLSGRHPAVGRSGYAATKAALRAFADVLRREAAPAGIRVSLVEPGLTATNLRSQMTTEAQERMAAYSAGLAGVTALAPEDVAQCVVWIADRPAGVMISDLTIIPISQAAAAMS